MQKFHTVVHFLFDVVHILQVLNFFFAGISGFCEKGDAANTLYAKKSSDNLTFFLMFQKSKYGVIIIKFNIRGKHIFKVSMYTNG